VALLALLVASERPAADIADACVGENTAGRLRRNGPVCRAPGFYGSSFTPANFPQAIFLRRSSSDDLPPAIFVTGTRSHNLHLTA
jgi:hypothetical protein